MSENSKIDPQQEAAFLVNVRKNLNNLMGLRALGVKVDVTVFRLPQEKGLELVKAGNFDKHASSEAAQPKPQLRQAHIERAATISASASDRNAAHSRAMRNNYLYPKGGFVRIELTHPITNQTIVGEGHVGLNEIFCRRRAGARASGKLLKRLLNASGFGGSKSEKTKIKAILSLAVKS